MQVNAPSVSLPSFPQVRGASLPSPAMAAPQADRVMFGNSAARSRRAGFEKALLNLRDLAPNQRLAAEDLVAQMIQLTRTSYGKAHDTQVRALIKGPMGSGKTQLARRLAQETGRPVFTLDMAMFRESFELHRLSGIPKSMIGSGSQGFFEQLPENAIVLLDEVEKAAPAVRDYLRGGFLTGEVATTGGVKNIGGVDFLMTAGDGSESKLAQAFTLTEEEQKTLPLASDGKPQTSLINATTRVGALTGEALTEYVTRQLEKMTERFKVVSGTAVVLEPSVGQRVAGYFKPGFGLRSLRTGFDELEVAIHYAAYRADEGLSPTLRVRFVDGKYQLS